MAITVKHLKVSTIPDTTDTDLVRPSDWNADHTIVGTNDIANGGTNSTATPTAGAVAYGTGTAYAFSTAGTAGQVLQSNGTSAPSWVTSPAAGAGGANTQIQFNNAGVLAGNSTYTMVSSVMKENGFNFVSQADVGSNPNQVPLNQYLGNMAYQDSSGVVLTGDARINGITAGLGAGQVATNTVYGKSAFGSNVTGASNLAVGQEALRVNTASNNTAVGYQAGYNNTTGTRNTFIGNIAGSTMSTGSECVFVGDFTGRDTLGSNNTFVGRASGYKTTSGATNSFFGYFAGSEVTTGSKNTIVGAYTGNQDGLDIRTASNYAVISDGDGGRLLSMASGYTLALDSAIPQTGTGITFPATQSASSDANTLDDYEEGTWTPSFASSGGGETIAYGSQRTGRYTKIGRVVYFQFDVELSSKSGGSGDARITGLPFTSENLPVTGGATAVFWANTTTYAPAFGNVSLNSTRLDIRANTTTNSIVFSWADITATTRLIMFGFYTV